ncbi:H-NS histone family protein [Bradyrhizobium sp. ARR65]|uniref:H-NS family nucleoid-associated regulatory protein n=1 Tax=Bradyrhizobium sp. ARR65 TaxID=1040989 RepID=UPI000A02A090
MRADHIQESSRKNPSETWSGRGKQPRWLAAQLQAGKELEPLLIAVNSSGRGCP